MKDGLLITEEHRDLIHFKENTKKKRETKTREKQLQQ
jgi:hypothetical protein